MKHVRMNFILDNDMYHDLGITKFAYSSFTSKLLNNFPGSSAPSSIQKGFDNSHGLTRQNDAAKNMARFGRCVVVSSNFRMIATFDCALYARIGDTPVFVLRVFSSYRTGKHSYRQAKPISCMSTVQLTINIYFPKFHATRKYFEKFDSGEGPVVIVVVVP